MCVFWPRSQEELFQASLAGMAAEEMVTLVKERRRKNQMGF